MRTRLGLWLVFLLISSACGSPRPADSPLLVYLQADPSGAARLMARKGMGAEPQPLAFTLPPDCLLYGLYPSPREYLLAAEFSCPGGPAVWLLDLYTARVSVPSEAFQADARYLAWSADGRFLYLKADTLGAPFVLRVKAQTGSSRPLDLPETVYDLAVLPDGRLVYALTRGLGYGSEVWAAAPDGRQPGLLFSEPEAIVAYLRPSPDGRQLAYIRMPDSSALFPPGELWLREVSGANARFLAEADAGHGYAPAWSPDGNGIAFVTRLTSDPFTSGLSYLLLSNTGVSRLESFEQAVVEAPLWSPDGSLLAFNVVQNGTIQAWIEAFPGGIATPLGGPGTCCAVWLPGK